MNGFYFASNKRKQKKDPPGYRKAEQPGNSYVLTVRVANSRIKGVLYDRAITSKKDDSFYSNISEIANEMNIISLKWE